ncbi:MAG: TonB family protein [Fibrella sp.]|nr:TonB family protein [Armatimonadota bacterium]
MRATNPKRAVVEFTVRANGSSTYNIVRSSGNKSVDAAVLKACASYRWHPVTRGGKPADSRQRVAFTPGE